MGRARPAVRVLHAGHPLHASRARSRAGDDVEEKLDDLLGGHICRCTGYQNVRAAVRRWCGRRATAAAPRRVRPGDTDSRAPGLAGRRPRPADQRPPAAARRGPLRRRPAPRRHGARARAAQPGRARRTSRAFDAVGRRRAARARARTRSPRPPDRWTASGWPRASGRRRSRSPTRRVRYVGQPIGIVVAACRPAAEDAAELVEVDYDELPTVADPEAAIAAGRAAAAPRVGHQRRRRVRGRRRPRRPSRRPWPGRPRDRAPAGHPAHRARARWRPAASWRSWDANLRELTVWSSTQTPHHVRDHLALSLGLSADQVRVIAPDLGGGFGSKEHLYPDEVLVALAVDAARPPGQVDRGPRRALHRDDARPRRDPLRPAGPGRRRPVRRDRQRHRRQPRRPPVERGHGPLPHLRARCCPGPYRFASAGVTHPRRR